MKLTQQATGNRQQANLNAKLAKNLFFALLILLISSPSIFAFPNWETRLYSAGGDECVGYTIRVSNLWGPGYPTPEPTGELTMELQVFQGGIWQTIQTQPRSVNFDPDFYFYNVQIPSGKNNTNTYRCIGTFVYDPSGQVAKSKHNRTIDLETLGYPEIGNFFINEVTDNPYYVVDNCFPEEYELILEYDNPNDYVVTSYNIYEADANGSALATITSGQQYVGGPTGGQTFNDIINEIQGAFVNLLDPNYTGYPGYQGYTGFVVIDMQIDDIYCGNSNHYKSILVKINEQPYVSNFKFRYINVPHPTAPTYFSFAPSHDINNPTQLGGQSGHVLVDISTNNYDYWDMKVDWWNPNSQQFENVGNHSGTNPISGGSLTTYLNNQPTFNYTTGQINTGQLDIPAQHPNEVFRFTLTIGTANCGDDSEYGYFQIPSNLTWNKTSNTSFTTTYDDNSIEVEYLESAIASNSMLPEYAVLYNISGQKVMQTNFDNQKITLNKILLAHGMYILRVFTKEGNVLWTEKVLK